MDLSYSSEAEAYRETVAKFLADNWPLKEDEKEGLSYDEQCTVFRERATEAGYLYRNIPKQYGGSEQEPDVLLAQVIREEFTRTWAPMEARGIGTMMLVPTLLERGEEWMKDKFVVKTLLGEIKWCQGYSEPGSGSDLASLKTRGEIVGDEWVINGQKIWTTNAHEADYMFILVRTEPDASKHAGISYLLIDMHQPGIEVRPLRTMTGTAEFNEVFLSDAKTPKDWIVGKRGEGWNVSRTTLKHERNSIGATEQTNAFFAGLVKLAQESKIDGKPAIENERVRAQLSELEGYIMAHKYSGYRGLTADATGNDPGIIRLMTKLASTEIGHRVAKLSMDLMGDDGMMGAGQARMGAGVSGSQAWLGQYMYSLGIAIAGGSANIQRNVIAERGLGLPRDAAADRSKLK
ncbi:MAG: alkylation response protein AidB-like acyl-CoA dehydrogenase [Myxococcota bacterium]|jgi:alkylation response protein AidB-like acyl-CoA dehydrogenase